MTVDEVADVVVEVMGLEDVEKVYRPMLHGIGWPGDVKKVALRIDRLMMLGFKPKMRSREAVARTVAKLLREINKES